MEIRACCQYLGTPVFVTYGCVLWLRIKPFPNAEKTKEMFYGLVASVDGNFIYFERDVLWSGCSRRRQLFNHPCNTIEYLTEGENFRHFQRKVATLGQGDRRWALLCIMKVSHQYSAIIIHFRFFYSETILKTTVSRLH